MMHTGRRLLFLVVALGTLPACGQDLQGIVKEYIAQRGGVFPLCGSIQTAQCGAWQPTAADQAVLTCLSNGMKLRNPARGDFTTPTVEGDPIRKVVLVQPEPDYTINVILFIDTTSDEFGPQQITRTRCDMLKIDYGCGGLLVPHQCDLPVVY